jgi:protein disulfide-isomerase A1
MLPNYHDFATANKANPTLRVCKIINTEQLPANLKISGYPTIFFFKANDKQNHLEFEGPREPKSFTEFVEYD